MKRFDIITIFPDMFDSYFGKAIVKRARDMKKTDIRIHDLRHFTDNPYQSIDDTPYGGGAGMVMRVDPLYKAVKSIRKKKRNRIIVFSAKSKRLHQHDLIRLHNDYDQLILICGRYEGIDERVIRYIADEEISIGEYVLTGGEIPAMVIVDGISRLIPGVLGNQASLEDESHSVVGKGAAPQYTKPETYGIDGKKRSVPPVLLSGHHANIEAWREKQRRKIK